MGAPGPYENARDEARALERSAVAFYWRRFTEWMTLSYSK